MSKSGPYDDDELAALFDLDHDGHDADLWLYEQFAARGETPVLELGAGSGRVAAHLARAGYGVVALDASAAMLQRLARRLDAATAPLVRAVEGDMRKFDLGERFDLIFCAADTFGHLVDADDQADALRCIAAHLTPGGVFVAETRAVAAVDWTPGPAPLRLEWTRDETASGALVTKFSSMRASPATQTTETTMLYDIAPRAGGPVRRRTVEVTMRVIGLPEIELLLDAAGLRLQQAYGGPDLSPFDDTSDTMVIVAGTP